MKKQQLNHNILTGIFCIAIAFTVMAFKDSTTANKQVQQVRLDTVPKNNSTDIDIEINMKDIEQTIKKSLEAAEKSMKEFDRGKITKQIEQGLKDIDIAKMQVEIEKSMNKVDWDKMKQEIDKSIKEIDLSKMKVNLEKMKNDIALSLKEIKTDALKKSMEEIKKINFDDLKKEIELSKDQLKPEMEKFRSEMDKVKIEMQKVKSDMSDVKIMLDEMEKDGLINKKETNTIEFKDKDLLINGKKQTPEISEKYHKYLKGDSYKFKFNGN